mgnify:FL=1
MAKRIGKFKGITKRESALSLRDGGTVQGNLTVAGTTTFNGVLDPSGGLNHATPVDITAADGTKTLTLTANSGRTNIIPDMTGNSGIIKLPNPVAAGEYYHFIYGGADVDGHNLEIQTTATDTSVIFKGAVTHLDTTADDNSIAVIADGDSNDVLELKVLEALDLHFLSYGTGGFWVWGSVTSATVPAFADS